mmetsp:Transcript_27402/g.26479  ORF Transcript_27402/g.26479 Transcript_27402/m.26479 type:complete len:207 (+) Transcript_27402:422-1042(+)
MIELGDLGVLDNGVQELRVCVPRHVHLLVPIVDHEGLCDPLVLGAMLLRVDVDSTLVQRWLLTVRAQLPLEEPLVVVCLVGFLVAADLQNLLVHLSVVLLLDLCRELALQVLPFLHQLKIVCHLIKAILINDMSAHFFLLRDHLDASSIVVVDRLARSPLMGIEYSADLFFGHFAADSVLKQLCVLDEGTPALLVAPQPQKAVIVI